MSSNPSLQENFTSKTYGQKWCGGSLDSVVTSYHSTPSPSGQDDILPLAQSNLLLVVHAIQLFTCLTLDTEEKKSLESRLNPISVQYALSNVLLLHKDGSTSTQPPQSQSGGHVDYTWFPYFLNSMVVFFKCCYH